jgi:hypothetical protein
MKKIVVLFLISVALGSCFRPENNCKNFKTGTFRFDQIINGTKHTTTFLRTDTYQIETYKGQKDTATVRWVNDCEFILEKVHPKSREDKKAISMRILSTTDSTYTFEFSFVNDIKKQIGTVTKIN